MAINNDENMGLAGFFGVIVVFSVIIAVLSAIIGGIIVAANKNKKEMPKSAKQAFEAAKITAIIAFVAFCCMGLVAFFTVKGPYDR